MHVEKKRRAKNSCKLLVPIYLMFRYYALRITVRLIENVQWKRVCMSTQLPTKVITYVHIYYFLFLTSTREFSLSGQACDWHIHHWRIVRLGDPIAVFGRAVDICWHNGRLCERDGKSPGTKPVVVWSAYSPRNPECARPYTYNRHRKHAYLPALFLV